MRLEALLCQSSGGCGAQQRSVAASAKLVAEGRVAVDGMVVVDRSHQVLLNAEVVSLDGVVVDTVHVFDRSRADGVGVCRRTQGAQYLQRAPCSGQEPFYFFEGGECSRKNKLYGWTL